MKVTKIALKMNSNQQPQKGISPKVAKGVKNSTQPSVLPNLLQMMASGIKHGSTNDTILLLLMRTLTDSCCNGDGEWLTPEQYRALG